MAATLWRVRTLLKIGRVEHRVKVSNPAFQRPKLEEHKFKACLGYTVIP